MSTSSSDFENRHEPAALPYEFFSPVHLRWADIDALQHVNNAVYLSYFEQARIDYFRALGCWDWNKVGMILARTEVDYLRPLLIRDRAWVLTRTVHLGSKSFTMEYLIVRKASDWSADLRPCERNTPGVVPQELMEQGPLQSITKARSVLVAFDFESNQSVPVPEPYRDAILRKGPRPVAPGQ
ncbi:MAG: acyl-CoA thioesterase [Bacteroidetes bacterium]|nr:acyl-CoA thioesterase [Bacteroidota bacterium]